MWKLFSSTIIILSLIILSSNTVKAEITEKKLSKERNDFLSMAINENPDDEEAIRETLDSYVSGNGSRIRVLDKFALFLYSSERNGTTLESIKFFRRGGSRVFFLVLKDSEDGQTYTAYIEYLYDRKKESSNLKNIYFSVVFDEKMRQMEKFFRER